MSSQTFTQKANSKQTNGNAPAREEGQKKGTVSAKAGNGSNQQNNPAKTTAVEAAKTETAKQGTQGKVTSQAQAAQEENKAQQNKAPQNKAEQNKTGQTKPQPGSADAAKTGDQNKPVTAAATEQKKGEQNKAQQGKAQQSNRDQGNGHQNQGHEFHVEHDSSTKETTFHFESSSAKSVLLAGDFSEWDKAPIHMMKGGGNVWHAKVALSPGRHAYRFLVDGEWQNDPNRERIPNSFGTFNSVMDV